MLINISDLTGKKISKQEINMCFHGENIIFDREKIEFAEPINIKGVFSMSGEIISFDGVINTTLKLICSRCAENFNYPVEIEMNEKFSKIGNYEDNEIITINSDEIDFSPIVENNIILSLPIKKLCTPNCLGLCSVCGTNLNHSKCNCEKDDLDPRLAKLKELFSK